MKTLGLTQHLSSQARWPLHSVEQTQALEHQAQASLPANTLMQRAGLATAQLAMAIAPHARTIWIACGPGNNGGDGLEAAVHLQAWGKQPIVTWLGNEASAPSDALHAWHRAKAAGVTFATQPPQEFDLAIDALLGIGAQRAPEGLMAQWLNAIQASNSPLLCVDIPTGLLADTGEWIGAAPPQHTTANTRAQRHTLSLLTLKQGLFTADGQDAAGQVWFNDLKVAHSSTPEAWLQQHGAKPTDRPHNSHKGSFGDVSVLGGAPGMSGAAMLAGFAALHGGAGRVLLGLMDNAARHAVTATHPALMVRAPADLNLTTSSVVCGCGGGDDIHALLQNVLSCSQKLVLDADALNAIARDTSLQTLLKKTQHTPKTYRAHAAPVGSSAALELHRQRRAAKPFACRSTIGQYVSMCGGAQRLRQHHYQSTPHRRHQRFGQRLACNRRHWGCVGGLDGRVHHSP
jgi:hydroxyethylthiazole kinase-like uncharacterized protein yjeF